MHYFLTYDNACPLFVGGENHGKKVGVPSDYPFWNLAVVRPFFWRAFSF